MNCTWKSTSQCLKLFKAIQHSNSMINMMFGPDGVSIMSMDTSKISLVRLILTPAFFESFTCEQPMVFGIYTETLSNVLQKAKQSTLHWKASDDGALTIVLQEQDFQTEFTLRSILIDDDYLEIPVMQDDVAFEVVTTVVQDWTSKVLMTNSDVAFDINQQQFICSSESTELVLLQRTSQHCPVISRDEIFGHICVGRWGYMLGRIFQSTTVAHSSQLGRRFDVVFVRSAQNIRRLVKRLI